MEHETETETETTFSKLSDDVVLKIFTLLEDHPCSWACLSCVCTKFNSLISSILYKSKCVSSLSSDLLSLSSPSSSSSSDDVIPWSSLFKLSVCCPGLFHSGVLLDNSDFGLHRELGSHTSPTLTSSSSLSTSSSSQIHHHHHDYRCNNNNDSRDDDDDNNNVTSNNTINIITSNINNNNNNNNLFEGWSLYDDLYFDTVFDNSETYTPVEVTTGVANLDSEFTPNNKRRKVINDHGNNEIMMLEDMSRRKQLSHLASGVWNLSREQGLKLLASRFRDDCLYISDWPGCVHSEDYSNISTKRKYMVFRGIFKNFKKTRVWRTIKDGNSRSKVELNCAFCLCKETWDLHSAFCLKRGFGFHDDGEPVVRAYVCENGHVSGAWTDFPLYT